MTDLNKNLGNPTRVLSISGSLRRESFNTGLLKAAQELAPEDMEITIFDLEDIPFYNADVEAEGDPESVLALKKAVHDADALLLATPEYNGGIPAPLKNAIDWASRSTSGYQESAMFGKTVAIMGGGGGGAVRAQNQLRQVLSALGIEALEQPEVNVAMVWDKFDENGRLIDHKTREQINELLLALEEQLTHRDTLAEVLAA